MPRPWFPTTNSAFPSARHLLLVVSTVKKPLVIALIVQLVLMAGALIFMVIHNATAEAPRHAKAKADSDSDEVVEKAEPHAKEAAHEAVGDHLETPPSSVKAADADAHAAKEVKPNPEGFAGELTQGNARFVEGVSRQRDVLARRGAVSEAESPEAVVVTCTDSRVVPELVFDQPLGTFTVIRLPGAQLDDVAVRAVDDALSRLHAKSVMFLGHLGCHHVQQTLGNAGKKKNSRPTTLVAALGGLSSWFQGDALEVAATDASVTFATKELKRRSKVLSRSQGVTTMGVVYEPKTGKARWLTSEATEPPPRSVRN